MAELPTCSMTSKCDVNKISAVYSYIFNTIVFIIIIIKSISNALHSKLVRKFMRIINIDIILII